MKKEESKERKGLTIKQLDTVVRALGLEKESQSYRREYKERPEDGRLKCIADALELDAFVLVNFCL